MDYSKHLFRASSFGVLVSGKQGITPEQHDEILKLETRRTAKKGLTDKQTEGYNKLLVCIPSERTEATIKKISDFETKRDEILGLTPTMETKLADLIFKRDNTILSKGAKTALRKIRREIKFSRRKELKSKYLKKGIQFEEEAIDFLSIWHNRLFTNNKLRVEDDYFSGEVDITEGYDTKCSWELDTLPDPIEALDTLYEYQNRVYMRLHNAEQWTTSYVLINATDWALKDMIYREGFNWKDNLIPDWKKLEILNLYIYDEKSFIKWCKDEDCIPDLIEYESQLKTDTVNPDLEKAVNIFTNFVEIPDHERIVEKTTYRDLEIEKIMIDIVKLSRDYLQEVQDAIDSNIKES